MESSLTTYPPWTSGLEPAPGDLRIVQAFVNTRDLDEGTDELPTPQKLSAWLARWGLLAPGSPLGAGDWQAALEIREALRALLLAHHGEPADADAVTRLNSLVEAASLRVRFDTGGGLRLSPGGEGFEAALGRLLQIVADARVEGRWERLKVCANDACLWAFYDGSKNRSGKWCSMRRCGNQLKARAYRRRRPTGGGGRRSSPGS